MTDLIRDSRVWIHMIMLSLVNLSGMIVLMAIIIWQMHSNIIHERKQSIRAQVVSTLGVVEKIYGDYQHGDLTEEKAKQLALSSIAAMKYPENGYFWVINDDGVMLMHPYDRSIVGKSVLNMPDAHGRPFVREFILAAHTGGGFASYDWRRPAGGNAAAKIAYVMPFKPWNWIIGSGLYIDDLRTDSIRQISMGAALIFVLFGINIAISLRLSRRYIRELWKGSIHDVLTGLFTRSYLDDTGTRTMLRTQQTPDSERLAAIFFDLDHFKDINDIHGHKTGDIVLRTVGRIIKRCLRPNELAFRYGGEELVVLMHATEDDCRTIADRIRTAVHAHEFNIAGERFNVTISAGIAIGRQDELFQDLLRRADMCMYTAKAHGRNCTVTESELPAIPKQN